MAERGDSVAVVPSSASHFDAGLTCKIVGVLSDVGDSEFDDVGVHVWNHDDGRRPAVPDGGSFCGWEVGAAAANGRPGSQTKRQQSEAASAGGQGEVNYVANNIQNAKSYRQHGKPADVDYSSAVVCKTCVEPATYRYIPDNGKYRLSKALIQKLDARKPPKRPADARLLNPEQKRLQKEIQRELRREFELAEDRARAEDRERNGSSNAYSSQPSPSYRAVREQLEEERRHSGPEPEPKPTGGASPPADGCSSPIVLPPIAVPLVKNGGQSAASEGISSQVEAFREVSNAGGGGGLPNDHRRTRRGLHLGIRSRSEPPPGASVTSSGAGRSSLVSLEVTPTALRRDRTAPSSSGARSRGAAARERREGPEEAPRRQNDGWTGREPAGGRREDAGERAPPDDGRRRPTSVDGVSASRAKRTTKARVDPDVGSATAAARQASTCGVPLMQIKYMAASGEVCTPPNFGRSPERVSTDRPSCPTADEPPSAGVDVGRPDADDDASFATSKHLGPTPAKTRPKDARSYKPHAARTNNHVFSELNSGKLLSGGYRAVPVGQVRLSDQQPAESRRKDVDILPKISGRKVTMAVTSHRIV